MKIEHFIRNIKRRRDDFGLLADLGEAATKEEIELTEHRLAIVVPNQVRIFYSHCNGLEIQDPSTEVFPLGQLTLDDRRQLVFAVFDGVHQLCFDTTRYNEANQWSIMNYRTEYVVTLTMGSFWSNKMFAWLDKRRPIWEA